MRPPRKAGGNELTLSTMNPLARSFNEAPAKSGGE